MIILLNNYYGFGDEISSSQDVTNLPDPTIRIRKSSDPTLKAITKAGKNAFCVIAYQGQDGIFQKGDKFDVYTVIQIEDNFVMVSDANNTKVQLNLY